MIIRFLALLAEGRLKKRLFTIKSDVSEYFRREAVAEFFPISQRGAFHD